MKNKEKNVYRFFVQFNTIIATLIGLDINTELRIFILFYFRCKHCQALQPEWETVEKVLENNREYILGKVTYLNCHIMSE